MIERTKKEEVQFIRSQYEAKSEQQTKTDALCALDRKVRRPAAIAAYVIGAVGTLVLGTGMCLAMKVIGDLMPLGIAIGVVGIAIVCANYFVYKKILERRKKKYADQIIALSDEILNQ